MFHLAAKGHNFELAPVSNFLPTFCSSAYILSLLWMPPREPSNRNSSNKFQYVLKSMKCKEPGGLMFCDC